MAAANLNSASKEETEFRRFKGDDYYHSCYSQDEKESEEEYKFRHSEERLRADKWVKHELLEAKFDAISVGGRISFSQAEELARSANLIYDATNVQHYLRIYQEPDEETFTWWDVWHAIYDLAWVCEQSALLENDFRSMERSGRLTGTQVLAKLRDFAPYCSEEELVKFVLDRSVFFTSTKSTVLLGKEITPTDYAQLMCPFEVFRRQVIQERHDDRAFTARILRKYDAREAILTWKEKRVRSKSV
jgi:hypothetical protein